MKVEKGLQNPCWFLSLFQLSVSYWIQKLVYKGSFINGGSSQGPAAVLLWRSVVDKLKRNYRLFLLSIDLWQWKIMCETTFSQSGLTHWHAFSKQKSLQVLLVFAEICCFYLSANRTKHWPISLYSLALEERRFCAWNCTSCARIYFVISFSSLALSVQLLTSSCHLRHSVTLFFLFSTQIVTWMADLIQNVKTRALIKNQRKL